MSEVGGESVGGKVWDGSVHGSVSKFTDDVATLHPMGEPPLIGSVQSESHVVLDQLPRSSSSSNVLKNTKESFLKTAGKWLGRGAIKTAKFAVGGAACVGLFVATKVAAIVGGLALGVVATIASPIVLSEWGRDKYRRVADSAFEAIKDANLLTAKCMNYATGSNEDDESKFAKVSKSIDEVLFSSTAIATVLGGIAIIVSEVVEDKVRQESVFFDEDQPEGVQNAYEWPEDEEEVIDDNWDIRR